MENTAPQQNQQQNHHRRRGGGGGRNNNNNQSNNNQNNNNNQGQQQQQQGLRHERTTNESVNRRSAAEHQSPPPQYNKNINNQNNNNVPPPEYQQNQQQQQQQNAKAKQQQERQEEERGNNNNNNNHKNENNNNVKRNNNNNNNNSKNNNKRGGGKNPYVNTESFDPYDNLRFDLRIVVDISRDKLGVSLTERDILVSPMIFADKPAGFYHDQIRKEIKECPINQERLTKPWHDDAHHIVDHGTGFEKHCPTFQLVIARLAKFFNMKVNASRLNIYEPELPPKDQKKLANKKNNNSSSSSSNKQEENDEREGKNDSRPPLSSWKPLHFDAAAVKPQMAKIQNFTIGVSFGETRTAIFEDVETKKVVSLPLQDGVVYCFGREVNCAWRHGIAPEILNKELKSRISCICWGWVEQSRVEGLFK